MNKPGMLTANKSLEDAFLAENIYHSLQAIQAQLEKEITSKQKTIDRQEAEILKLRNDLDEKNNTNVELTKKFNICQKQAEGNRQLINKLLNDLDRLQQDLEWYKRTYESRSLLGTIRQKVFGRKK